jgi:hypothetical protein
LSVVVRTRCQLYQTAMTLTHPKATGSAPLPPVLEPMADSSAPPPKARFLEPTIKYYQKDGGLEAQPPAGPGQRPQAMDKSPAEPTAPSLA